MTNLKELPFSVLDYYATAPYPCSYLDDQEARSQVAAPVQFISTEVYSFLIQRGFRRSGIFTYRPYCDQCQACLPTRVVADLFQPNRSQQRAWKQHQHLIATECSLAFKEEHFALYQQYQSARHTGGGMDQDTSEQYTEFLLRSQIDTALIEFREPDGELKMVSIIDYVKDGLSSVYTFFDPKPHQSLGTYNILWQISQAKKQHLPHVYLGYWIAQSPKMRYKQAYQPLEVFHQHQWQRIENIERHHQ